MMEATEFTVSTDLVPITGIEITANFGEMEASLRELMEPYSKMVVTDLSSAKSARAYCRKVKDSIDASRKQVKKLWNSPYAAFEEKVKKLTGICDEAVKAIDEQVKAVEEAERLERVKSIEDFYRENVGDMDEYADLKSVWSSKWELKSAKADDIHDAIVGYINTVATEVEAIKAIGSLWESTLLDEYRRTHNLPRVMMMQKAFESAEQARLEREKKQAEQAAQEPERLEAEPEPEPAQPYTYGRIRMPEPEKKEHTFTLEFTCTTEMANALNRFLKQNNISFRRIK